MDTALRRHDLPPDAVLYVGGLQVIRVYQGHLLVWSAFTFSPRWKHLAACQGMPPELFIPEDPNEPPPPGLAELCSTCPVRLRCESYGRASQSSGWWGGKFLYFGQPQVVSNRRPKPGAEITATPVGLRKISVEQAAEIRARWQGEGVTQTELAEEYGVSRAHIRRIIGGQVGTTGLAALTQADVDEIRYRYATGDVLQRELAAEFGVTRRTISGLIGTGLGNRQANQTHCNQGHEFTPENTYVIPSSGARQCRQCKRDNQARRYHEARGA